MELLNKRRIIPDIQSSAAGTNSVTVNKKDDTVAFSFRPDDCMIDLPLIRLVNSFKSVKILFCFLHSIL